MKQPNPVDPAFQGQVTPPEDTSFGEILSQFEQEQQEPASIAPGQQVEGTVVAVHEDIVYVAVGRKTEGVLPSDKVRDESGNISVRPGDKILVNVVGYNQQGQFELSTVKVERPRDWTGLQTAFSEGHIIGGVVQEVIKGGLRVDVGVRAFMPASRSGARDISEMEKLVGQEIRCKIIKLEISDKADDADVVVDRRVVLEEEERQKKQAAFQSVQEGAVLKGTVKTLMDFGAFVDIGGVDGLLHVADISWTRINKPADVLKVGDQVEVKVLRVNPDTRKISLGMKQLQADPWSVAIERFHVGDRVHGTVARVTEFGAFVSLAPGVDGLVHVSEMSWSKKLRRPSDIVKVGDAVEVVVLGINAAEKRISLGLKQALGDPWEEAEKKYPVGSTVEAPITNLANFGAFVDLGDGIEGMIHVGDITRERRIDHPKDLLKTGQVVKAQVLEFDRERRRIRLGMKQLEPTSADTFIAEHKIGDTLTGRIVEVKNDRVRVEIAEGVFGISRIAAEQQQNESSQNNSAKADISALTAQLAARWKSGPDLAAETKVPKVGQIRSFRISALDPEQKRIQLETAD
jgi:small subunit ribosomal protein S1